ncbi:MAG TPA: hypothetical protein VN325_11260 [Steroidobacteraceae bacterium]|nr:hypothetical protein [Steroidobacteraceae bacterium]
MVAQTVVRQGLKTDERVTVISDGAGEFTKAVDGSQLANSPEGGYWIGFTSRSSSEQQGNR